MTIIGTLSGFSITNNALFDLDIESSCNIAIILSSPISSYSYDISEGTTNTITSIAWSISPSACTDTISYSITYLSYVYINSGVITVNTNNLVNVGTHTLTVTA
jgi:hypothetical protein